MRHGKYEDRTPKPKKKSWLMVISVTMVMVALLGFGTWAILKEQTKSLTNTFVAGTLTVTTTDTFDGTTKSAITVTNSGTSPAFIRVKLVTYWVDSNKKVVGRDAPDLSVNLGDDWIVSKSDPTLFYYKLPVKLNDSTKNLLGSSIKLTADNDYHQVVEVIAEGIQVGGNAAATMWGVTISNNIITDAP